MSKYGRLKGALFTAFNPEQLYNEVRAKAEQEGAYSEEQWDDMVEQVLEEKKPFGELHDDEDWDLLREELQNRWDEFRNEIRPAVG